MKKIITASMALLSVVVLAACSGKTTSDSSTKASSSVEQTSSSETSSTTSSSKTENNEVVLITDEEIDNAKTIGDMKTLYSKLVDNYKKYAQDIGDQIPESLRSKYTQQVEPALKTLDESKTQFDTALSTGGSDDTVVPEQGRTVFVQQLKSGRDTMKQALESAYKSIAPLLSSSAE